MKIILINPPWIVHGKKNVWRNVASIMPPLGIAWLGAVLEKEGHKVKILDAHAMHMSIRQIGQWLRENAPFDIVGITGTTPLIQNVYEISSLIKAEYKNVRIILGGVHPTVMPEEALLKKTVDIVARGEGERTILDVAADLPLTVIDGISYLERDTIVHNPDRELIKDLNSIPFPAYHLLPMEKYRPASGAAKRLPATSVLATRGCPGRCSFCYRIFGSRLRSRSGRLVAEEVKLLQERYGIKEICFYDDTFTAIKKEVLAFCQSLHDLDIDLSWSCFSRIDTFNEDIFREMKENGCHQVMYGVETANHKILKNINKRANPETVETVIRATQKIGIEVRGAFMLGNPGETELTMEENIRFAIDLEPDLAIFNITTPFPGTEMFKWADENNFLRTKDWVDYDLSTPVMNLPTVSHEKIKLYYQKAYRRFYGRPGFIWKRLKKLRNLDDLLYSIRGIHGIVGI